MKTFINLASVAAVTLAASAAQGAYVNYNYLATLASPFQGYPGGAMATFEFNTITHSLNIEVQFFGLEGVSAEDIHVANIHSDTAVSGTGTAGVSLALTDWPAASTDGFYNNSFNLLSTASYSSAYLAAHGGTAASAEIDLLAAMSNGRAYLSIDLNDHPEGQIGGFIYQDVSVPAPGMLALIGMCGVLSGRRRR